MRHLLLSLFILCLLPLKAQVKINELCYNPRGADRGKEWIELYNPTDEDIPLAGAMIFSGGSSFTLDFVFPQYTLRAKRFVVIGGEAVPQAHFIHNFSFQNGGSASDGVRFVSADGLYTDTVIYDSPNTNELPDDSGNPATSFAENAPEGYSLARVVDGYDTNASALDFIAEANPTPGLPNRIYADYIILEAGIQSPELIRLKLYNNSLFSPKANALLRVYEAEQLLYISEIEPIPPRRSIDLDIELESGWQLLFIELELIDDPNPANNTHYLSILPAEPSRTVINELYPMPESGQQEWVELHLPYQRSQSRTFVLKDQSGNHCAFTLPPAAGYYVLCTDPEALLSAFPLCPPGSLISIPRLPSLNDSGDSLYLYNYDESRLLDSLSYTSSQIRRGKSLRRMQSASEEVYWISGEPSPGKPNTNHLDDEQLKPDGKDFLRITGSPLKEGESIVIAYDLKAITATIDCSIWDLEGRLKKQLLKGNHLPAEGMVYWDGNAEDGRRLKRGIYLINWLSTDNNKKQRELSLPVVIR